MYAQSEPVHQFGLVTGLLLSIASLGLCLKFVDGVVR